MKRIKSSSSLTKLVNNIDLPEQQKQNFAEYIESKKKKEQINVIKNFNKVITDYQENQNAFDLSNTGISGLDPENVKIINRIQKDIICIDSKYRNTNIYPNSNYFKTFLGKNFKNVVKIRLASTQIPNVEEVIRNVPVEIQNNIIAWQNEEDSQAGIKKNCPFVYLPNEKKIQVTITDHGLTIGSSVLVKFSNSSIPSNIDLIGERTVLVVDSNIIELDYDALSNFIGTITVDIGQPIYKIELTPGSYDSVKIASEIETKINLVKRSNGEFHYMTVDVNNRTDIFTFSNYNIQKLLPSSISTVLGSNFITVNQVSHSFKNGEIVYIENITRLGGIPSESLNGLFTVVNATLNSFQYETNSTASQTSSGGGNSVIIGKQMPFRFLFDSENTLIQYNIGFPNEDSAESIGSQNPISTNVLNVSSFENNIPTNFTTITTSTPHYLNGNKFIDISDITTNSNPVYITTTTEHNISDKIKVKLKGFTTTPDINELSVDVIPLTNTKLIIDSDTLLLTSNTTNYSNAYMYYGSESINIYNLIAHSNNVLYENHLNIPVYSVISDNSFTIENTYNYVDYNSVNISTIGTNKLIINHPNHSFNNITELYTNSDLPIYSGFSSNYDSINLKTLAEHSYSNRYKTNSILLENGDATLASSSRTITSITIPTTGTVRFALNSVYYYTIGESITIAGTTALNGTYIITNVDYSVTGPAPFSQYTVSAIYISTDITNTSSSSPTIVPNFHKENTIRIIFPQHQLDTNNIIRILDTSILGPELKDYLIEKISDNSFLIEYTHTSAVSDTTISILQKTDTVDINDSNYTTPQLIGTNDFFNKYDIKATSREIALGDLDYLTTITLPEKTTNTNVITDFSGKYVSILQHKWNYSVRTRASDPGLYSRTAKYNTLLISDNYGVSFDSVSPDSINHLNTGDFIQIIDNGGNNLLNENINYPITALSDTSLLINVPHSSIFTDTYIKIKNPYSTEINPVLIDCIAIDNDNTYFPSDRIITNIEYITGTFDEDYNSYGIVRITINQPYYYTEGEFVVITGTDSLDGTHEIIADEITNVDYNHISKNTFCIKQIVSGGYTFSGSPIVSVSYNSTNSIRVIVPYKYPSSESLNQYYPLITLSHKMTTDGSKIFVFTDKFIYKSIDFGASWSYIDISSFNLKNVSVNINSTGQYILLIGLQLNLTLETHIYSSIDFGNSFVLRQIYSNTEDNAISSSISQDGRYQIICYTNNTPRVQVIRSNDFGTSFADVILDPINPYLISDLPTFLNASEDGRYVTIILRKVSTQNFDVFVSNNFGESFTIKNTFLDSNNRPNYNISIDKTGRYQIISGGRVSYSSNYGESWVLGGGVFGNGLWDGLLGYVLSSLNLSGNSFYFYSVIQSEYPSGAWEEKNTLYKWNAGIQEITFQVEPSRHYYQNGDTIQIENHPDTFINGIYTVSNKTDDSFEIIPNFLIVPTSNNFKGTVKNTSRLNVIIDTQNSFTSSGSSGILIENESSTTFNINSITRVSDTLIKIKLDSIGYYLNPNESVTVSGTNNLNGIYTISNVIYNPNSLNLITEFYIESTETDLSFTSPTILPNFYSIDTLRILLENHNLNENDTIYISNSGGSGVPVGYYTITTVLSAHSFLINYTHTPTISDFNIIIQYSKFPLGIVERNQNIALYRIEGKPQLNLINTIGGINVENLNNRYYKIEKILDENNYIINSSDTASFQEIGGGSNIYVSSIIHGLRKQQLNTVDGTDLTKLFRSISLEGYNYIFLVSSGVETKLDVVYNNSRINNVFAKILLNQPPGHMCFDSFISAEKVFTTPIPELSELLFAIYTPDGYLYNFNDTNYSLDLEITTIIEEIENSNISSKNNKKLVLYQ